MYAHDVSVTLVRARHKIRVRPAGRLSRALSNPCLVALLWLTLLYPLLWLYRRFARGGGGRWAVCGGAYALKAWERLPPGAPLPPAGAGRWMRAPDGEAVVLVGESEGEWFQRWERTIRSSVQQRVRTNMPIQAWVPPLPAVWDPRPGYQPGYQPGYMCPPPMGY